MNYTDHDDEPGRRSHHYPEDVERVLDEVDDVPQVRDVLEQPARPQRPYLAHDQTYDSNSE